MLKETISKQNDTVRLWVLQPELAYVGDSVMMLSTGKTRYVLFCGEYFGDTKKVVSMITVPKGVTCRIVHGNDRPNGVAFFDARRHEVGFARFREDGQGILDANVSEFIDIEEAYNEDEVQSVTMFKEQPGTYLYVEYRGLTFIEYKDTMDISVYRNDHIVLHISIGEFMDEENVISSYLELMDCLRNMKLGKGLTPEEFCSRMGISNAR